jgi:hypothetical protein
MEIISRAWAALRRATVERQKFPLSELPDNDLALIVNLMFLAVLGRPAEPTAIEFFRSRLRKDLSLESFKAALEGSDEACGRPESQKTWQTTILGTDKILTKELWDERVAVVRPQSPKIESRNEASFEHSGQYVVSAIASIYKARRFLEPFLENITSQTMFDRSELIIVDANSPEGEEQVIRRYQETFPNIVYKRMNYRIGIYDAWNVGIELARGKYLTNTNVDDLRRIDSFEIQANTLDAHEGADVVYQNFFYTFDPSLSFEQVAEIGFESDLPVVSSRNLILFNSPHNAPMWRRELHSDVGLFDTSFKSAGDWEFWLRSITRGKSFHRIETPHIVYYCNPEGVSTRADTRGIEEGRWVRMRYRRLLNDGL